MKREQKKELTTYDRLMKKPGFKEKFKKEREALAISEMLIELMEKEEVSVRKLAKQSGVSQSVIQDIRSGKATNPTLSVLSKLIHSFGGEIVFRKGKKTLATV